MTGVISRRSSRTRLWVEWPTVVINTPTTTGSLPDMEMAAVQTGLQDGSSTTSFVIVMGGIGHRRARNTAISMGVALSTNILQIEEASLDRIIAITGYMLVCIWTSGTVLRPTQSSLSRSPVLPALMQPPYDLHKEAVCLNRFFI